MSVQPVPIAYTNRDFWAIQEALKYYIQQKFPDTWKDWYASSTGQILLDVIAAAFDNLSFQLDYTANELYLDTARDRRSVLLLGKLMGYKLATARSASVACAATIAATYAQNIVVPAGTAVKTKAGVDFYTLVDQKILAGQQSGTLTFVQGVVKTASFVSDGTAFQRLQVVDSSIVQSTVLVSVAGTEWTEVDSLVYAEATSQNYAVEFDENGNCFILFGDNTVGAVPPLGSAIEVTYRVGGGVVGNIPLNDLNTTVQGQKEGVSPAAYIDVTVINDAEAGSGGEEEESTTHAKLWIPRWVQTNNRAVTEQDYDTLANLFADPTYGSVAYAKSGLHQSIPELNTVDLAVWSRDSQGNITLASTGLKSALSDYFNNDGVGAVKMVCTRTEVIDGEILYLDVDCELGIKSNFSSVQVLADVNTALTQLFADATGPGEDVRISLLYAANQAVAGVIYSIIRTMSLSKASTQTLTTGDGVNKAFTGTIDLDAGHLVAKQSLSLSYGSTSDVLSDDGLGNIINSAQEVVGSIDYETGYCEFTFANIPDISTPIVASYRYIFDYQRSGTIGLGTGTKRRFVGTLTNAPVVAQHVVDGVKVKGIAFSDGSQIVVDDGEGNMTGDVESASGTVNKIDYDSGAYDFTFATAPAPSAAISFTYCQLLLTAAQDLPVDPFQLWIKGNVNLTVANV